MVILYNPPSSANRKPVMPLSLLALGAMLEGRSDYAIVDGNLEADELQALERAIRGTGADILGVTVMPGPQLNHAVPVCRTLKRLFPKLRVIWGGYFPTQHADACLASGFVDYVVRGFGEASFLQLVAALQSDGDVAAVPGIVFRDSGRGQMVRTTDTPVPDPDGLPDYPYPRIDVRRYLRKSFMGERTVAHHSSYGCPHACDFCAVGSMARQKWRAQSAEHLARIVGRLVADYGADAVEFYDNDFFVNENRAAEFADRIAGLGIGWWAEGRIDELLGYADPTWARLRDSGLRMAFMGAETGSDATLQRMNKGATASVDKTLAIAAKMKEYGIVPEFSFVLGNPPDPEADVKQTLAFIREVKRVNPAAEIVFYTYTPVPSNGELHREAERRGFRFPESLDEWTTPPWREFSQRRGEHIPWLSPKLRHRVRDFECVTNAFYPTVTDVRLRGPLRWLLRGASAWRFKLDLCRWPYELMLLQKLFAYRRPETSGL